MGFRSTLRQGGIIDKVTVAVAAVLLLTGIAAYQQLAVAQPAPTPAPAPKAPAAKPATPKPVTPKPQAAKPDASPAAPEPAAVPAAPDITLENKFVKLIISPAVGGRVQSFIHKATGRELALTPDKSPYWGLLADGLWQQNFEHSDWNRFPYKVVSADANKVVLEGAGRQWVGVTIRKTLTLAADRSAVEVEYQVTAADPSPARAMGDLWIHNGIAAGSKVYMPQTAGVIVRPTPGIPESWGYEPTRGWIGSLNGEVGLVAAMEFDRLRTLRTTSSGGESDSMEWMLRKASLKPGTDIKTWATLAPVTGLKAIDGVGRTLAVEIECGQIAGGKAPVILHVAGFETGTATINVTVRKLPDGQPQKVTQEKVAFAPDKPATISVNALLPGDGSYVIACDFLVGDKSVLACEKLVTAGKPSGVYAMASQGPRVGETPDYPTKNRVHPIDMNFNSQDVYPAQRVWAKPYAGGRPKVLILLPKHEARQAVELAQRFDLDITVPFITDTGFYALGDRYLGLNMKDVWAEQEKLILGKKFDVVIFDNTLICANNTQKEPLITLKCREYIFKMIQDGAGLVLIQRGDVPPELAEAVPLKHLGYDWSQGAYILQKTNNPVLNGIPFEALPEGHDQNGTKLRERKAEEKLLPEVEPDTVLVTCVRPASTYPSIATAQWGKGRLAQVVWNTPLLPNSPTVRGREMKDPPPFDYWEYHHMILGRLIYWAARMESPVGIEEIACTATQVKVSLASKTSGAAQVEWRLRDEFGTTLHSATEQAVLLKDANTITLNVPAAVGGSYYLADIVLKGDQGVFAFGAGVLKRAAMQIKSVATDKPMYDAKETAQVTVELTAPAPSAQIRVDLLDGFGRKVAEVTAPAAGDKTTLQVPLARLMGVVVDLRVTVLDGGKTADQSFRSARLIPNRERERAKFQTFFWGGNESGPTYLINSMYRRYQDIGMSAEMENDGPLAHGRRELEMLNMPFISGSVGMSCNNGIRKADMETKGDAETFTSPKNPVALREGAAKAAKAKLYWNQLMFTMGDECRAPIPDTDFTKVGLVELRKWLQETQYKSLADLNAEWKTDFKSWEEVMPLTEAEAKVHGEKTKSFAAWADQQQFNKWIWARNAREAMAGFFSVDPETRAGESGTQEPDTYSGRDYWLIMQYYTALASYGGEQDNQQLSYNPSLLRYPWAGYGKPNPILRTSTMPLLGTMNSGIAVFHDKSHIDPDYSLPECGRDLRATFMDVSFGQGQLMKEAMPHQQPVYLLQSSSSLHGELMTGGKDIGRGAREGLNVLLSNLVVGYRHLSYEQVAKGELDKVGARVLFLPYSVALSDGECQAIRKWVQAGGTLMADLDAGIMTEHCRVLDKGQLDDVFGIDRSGAQLRMGKGNDKWVVSQGTDAATPGLAISAIETGLKGSATPTWTARQGEESAPAVFVNSFGKGKAYYFACDFFKAYAAATSVNSPEANRQTMLGQDTLDKMLRETGWTPPATAMSVLPDGKTNRPVFFRILPKVAGDQRYFLLCRQQGAFFENAVSDMTATVSFERPGYIYDILAGKELGYGDKLDVLLTDYTIRILAVLPYRVMGLTVDSPASAKLGQDAVMNVAVKTDGKAGVPGVHVIRTDVTSPSGKWNRTYSQNAVAKAGSAKIAIPFALNDEPGAWTVVLRDVASGTSETKAIKLE